MESSCFNNNISDTKKFSEFKKSAKILFCVHEAKQFMFGKERV